MSLYTNDGDKINTLPIFQAQDYAMDAQQIEHGEFYSYVNDLVGVYGGMKK